MNWELIKLIAEAIGAIFVVLFSIHKIYRPIKRKIDKWISMIESLWELAQSHDVKLQKVYNEVTPNGGSSIKDSIKRIESRQLVQELTMKGMLASSGAAYWKSDRTGKFIEVSKALCKLLGRTESELLGNNWVMWLSSEDRERIFDVWEECISNKIDFNETYSFIKPDGTRQKVSGYAMQLLDSDGNTLGVFGTCVAN